MEAWDTSSRNKKLVGQSIYPVYPRPKQPAINLRPRDGRPMMKENVMQPFLRTPNTDQRVMHCGDLAFTAVM